MLELLLVDVDLITFTYLMLSFPIRLGTESFWLPEPERESSILGIMQCLVRGAGREVERSGNKGRGKQRVKAWNRGRRREKMERKIKKRVGEIVKNGKKKKLFTIPVDSKLRPENKLICPVVEIKILICRRRK